MGRVVDSPEQTDDSSIDGLDGAHCELIQCIFFIFFTHYLFLSLSFVANCELSNYEHT